MNEIGIRIVHGEILGRVIAARMPTVLNQLGEAKFVPEFLSSIDVFEQVRKQVQIVAERLSRIERVFGDDTFDEANKTR